MKKIVLAPNPYRDRGLVLTNRAKELLELDGRETVVSLLLYGKFGKCQ